MHIESQHCFSSLQFFLLYPVLHSIPLDLDEMEHRVPIEPMNKYGQFRTKRVREREKEGESYRKKSERKYTRR